MTCHSTAISTYVLSKVGWNQWISRDDHQSTRRDTPYVLTMAHLVVDYMGWLYGFITVNMVPYGWFIMGLSWLYLKICYHMDLRTVPYGYVALISSNFDGTDAIEDQVNHQNPPFSGPSHIQIHSSVTVYWKSTMTVDYFPRFHIDYATVGCFPHLLMSFPHRQWKIHRW